MPRDTQHVLAEQFPPLSGQEALVEANRCLYCYDAPCTHACPTHIDIPQFIKKISSGNLRGSARTILESNLLGATCARVCPVQELCEGACVLGAEHRPIQIGRLQRHAMDTAGTGSLEFFRKAPASGQAVAVIGAGPAGLSCAGELARRGHAVTLFEKRTLPGGLSTFGIISLREPVVVALQEVDMITRMGVRIELGFELGRDFGLEELQAGFAAAFLGCGLGETPDLGIPGEELIVDGLEYIEQSKLNLAHMTVGRQVIVIGAGNTAIDCATVAKRLGAEEVVITYRRSAAEMTAYRHEFEFAKQEGIEFLFLTQPFSVEERSGRVTGLHCMRMELGPPDAGGRAMPRVVADSQFTIRGDQIVKAIGQKLPPVSEMPALQTERGKIQVNSGYETSIPGLYAGGDCIRTKGAASTVMAVQDGKLAALAIDRRLRGGS